MSSTPARPEHADAVDSEDDDELLNPNRRNPYATASRWRHEESSSFRKAAGEQHGQQQRGRHPGHALAREPEAHGRVSDLADFLNSSRITSDEVGHERQRAGSASDAPRSKPLVAASADARKAAGGADTRPESASPQGPPPDGKDVACGPLLNYRRMEGNRWLGSVLVVVKGGGKTQPFEPTLVLRPAGSQVGDAQNGELVDLTASQGDSAADTVGTKGLCLYSDPRNTFWRFDVAVDVQDVESRWEYTLPGLRFGSKKKPQRNVFHVPARTASFRIMFHSCNGFSVGTDEKAWCGPVLWNDVLRRHAEAPFHVM